MGGSVPLWLVLLLSPIFTLFLVFFSWQAVTTARDRDAPKGFGAVAVQIVSAPDIALDIAFGALDQMSRRVSGEWGHGNLRLAPAGRGFDVDGETRDAALLLTPDPTVARRWMLDEVAAEDAPIRPENRKVLHGIDMLRDGSTGCATARSASSKIG